MSTNLFEGSLLGDIGSFKNGVNFSKDKKCEVADKGTLGLINVKDIFNSGRYINFHELDRVSLANQKGIEKYSVEKGDIFFVRSSVKRDGIGLVSMSPITTKEAVHCGFVIRYRLTSKSVDPLYLTYTLLSPTSRQFLVNFSGGAAITNISQTTLSQMPVQLPPLPTQRKIAAILSAYDDLLENNTKRIKILEEMAQTIYNEWFVKFRFPGHEGVRMVDSELGMIPEGWGVKCLKDFGDVVTGKTPSTKDEDNFGEYIPFIKTPDMHGNVFCIQTKEKLSEKGVQTQKNKTIPPNSLCVSCIGTAGVVSITSRFSQTNQQINSLIPNKDTSREYLYFGLSGLKETINQYGANGATMVNLNKNKFENLKLIMPTVDVLRMYHQVTSPCFNLISTLQTKNLNIISTRDLLLPRLISGEVDISELDINVEEITA